MNMERMNHSSNPTHGSYTHMTFFWGTDSEILFPGWPGSRTGMYVLALIVVFLVSILLEWLSFLCTSSSSSSSSFSRAGIWKTAVHGVRMAFAYLLMLAVMSFNVGVLLAAVAGHVVGFGAFQGGGLVKRRGIQPEGKTDCGHPSSTPLDC